jgi:hypothetical protein
MNANKKSKWKPVCILINAVLVLTLVALLVTTGADPVTARQGDDPGIVSGRIVARDAGPRAVYEVKLIGVAEYRIVGVFNTILENLPGTIAVTPVSLHLAPGKPVASIAIWKVSYTGDDAFELENQVYRRLRNVTGETLSEDDLAVLKQIQPRHATSRQICFGTRPSLNPDGKHANAVDTKHKTWNNWPDAGFD